VADPGHRGAAPTLPVRGVLAPSSEVDTPSSGNPPSTFTPTSGERTLLAQRYELLGLVGSGGMGTVYRAHDRELDEVVALKVLRHEIVDAPGILERFRTEVKLARRVTHRNVARVFDIGEHEGERFLTMELVDGEPLSTILAREGAFDLERAADVIAAVAAGLASAHGAGVVHLDLKPDNVVIARDGRVVITDFGIARAIQDAGADAGALGALFVTPAYMAPEQLEGRRDIDARADIYALGALFYELLSGQRAWKGDSPYSVASARLSAPAPDPRADKPALPAAFAELVLRCMARKPEDRPASIDVVIAALGGLPFPAPRSGAAAAPTRRAAQLAEEPSAAKTVAVLPFHNSGAPADDYLAEELTDDLIDALSMTHGLKVRARGVVARFRGKDLDPREVGRELGVQVVVEGSVRRARGRVRIGARLISVADGFQLWAKRMEQPEEEVLSINDQVARAIIDALTPEGAGPAREVPSDPVAIDLYIRARHEHRKFWPDHPRRAVALFEQAVAIAPDDPMILSGMAMALSRLSFFVGSAEHARARRAAERAVAAAPNLSEPHLALGSVLLQMSEPEAAIRALRQAVSRGPGLAEAHAALGRLLIEVGAIDEGTARLEAAISLDPLVPLACGAQARALALLGRWAEADAMLGLLRADEGAITRWALTARMALWRRLPAADYTQEVPRDIEAGLLWAMGEVLRTSRRPEGMATVDDLRQATRGAPRRLALFLQMYAEILGFLGDPEETLEALRLVGEAGLIDVFWLERCPLFDAVRADARFTAVHDVVRRRAGAILAAYRAPPAAAAR
jgi:serine/threonine-protein kinase